MPPTHTFFSRFIAVCHFKNVFYFVFFPLSKWGKKFSDKENLSERQVGECWKSNRNSVCEALFREFASFKITVVIGLFPPLPKVRCQERKPALVCDIILPYQENESTMIWERKTCMQNQAASFLNSEELMNHYSKVLYSPNPKWINNIIWPQALTDTLHFLSLQLLRPSYYSSTFSYNGLCVLPEPKLSVRFSLDLMLPFL